MRRKVATTMDARLYERAKEQARKEGRPLNDLLEHALRRYLDSAGRSRSVVRETAGVFDVPREFVMEVAEADLYGELE